MARGKEAPICGTWLSEGQGICHFPAAFCATQTGAHCTFGAVKQSQRASGQRGLEPALFFARSGGGEDKLRLGDLEVAEVASLDMELDDILPFTFVHSHFCTPSDVMIMSHIHARRGLAVR